MSRDRDGVVVYFEDDEPDVKGFRPVIVTEPDHPYAGTWWPPGYILGYEDRFALSERQLALVEEAVGLPRR